MKQKTMKKVQSIQSMAQKIVSQFDLLNENDVTEIFGKAAVRGKMKQLRKKVKLASTQDGLARYALDLVGAPSNIISMTRAFMERDYKAGGRFPAVLMSGDLRKVFPSLTRPELDEVADSISSCFPVSIEGYKLKGPKF